MKIEYFFLTLCFLLLSVGTCPQNTPAEFKIMFYNVENYFDVKDDPAANDEEYTPKGERRWTFKRFQNKMLNLSKVILNASGWIPPQMIALCEIENRYVLERLLKDTPLQSFPYSIIHKHSPDNRGIDIAFLYHQDVFYPLEYQYFPLVTKDDIVIKTREILYVSGIVDGKDTLHLFVNHWPSRYSGLLESKPLRILAAKTLRTQIERVFDKFYRPKVVVMGDFNDQPFDESILEYLMADEVVNDYEAESLYNLSFHWPDEELGTIKYRSQWSVFDQIMVTGTLLGEQDGLYTEPEYAKIVKLPFLLEEDERYGGLKTKRTYYGFKYEGGFSDHLPVLLKLTATP